MIDPKRERIAFQIWWLIQKTGGDCTVHDMAELTGASTRVCQNIAHVRGWSGLYRYVSGRQEERDDFLDAMTGLIDRSVRREIADFMRGRDG